MHVIFLLARIYPFLAVSLAGIFVQLGIFYRRRTSKAQHVFWGLILFLLITAVLWGVFRGDLHSDTWVRQVVDSNP